MAKTLRDHAGAPISPATAANAVLVVIDAQREYVDGALPLAGMDAARAELKALLALARDHGVPVIHIVHHGRAGGKLFDSAGPHVAIISEATPLANESVIVKTLPNAFAGTDLDGAIRATGRTDLLVAGFMTHMCVSTTVRAALDLGYRSSVVASATATRDLPDGNGGVVPAATIQRAALAALGDNFAAIVADVAALVAAWESR